MAKQLKLINDFYYCRPGKGALSSNTCSFYHFLDICTTALVIVLIFLENRLRIILAIIRILEPEVSVNSQYPQSCRYVLFHSPV